MRGNVCVYSVSGARRGSVVVQNGHRPDCVGRRLRRSCWNCFYGSGGHADPGLGSGCGYVSADGRHEGSGYVVRAVFLRTRCGEWLGSDGYPVKQSACRYLSRRLHGSRSRLRRRRCFRCPVGVHSSRLLIRHLCRLLCRPKTRRLNPAPLSCLSCCFTTRSASVSLFMLCVVHVCMSTCAFHINVDMPILILLPPPPSSLRGSLSRGWGPLAWHAAEERVVPDWVFIGVEENERAIDDTCV